MSLKKFFSEPLENEVTDYRLYQKRRNFIKRSANLLGALSISSVASSRVLSLNVHSAQNCNTQKLNNITGDKPNTWSQITRYNNYYEFSTNKEAVVHLAQKLTIDPWNIVINGEVEKPLTLGMEDILSLIPQEERIYRLRCVEGWSMVIPWNGFSLCHLLKRAKPTSKAKYVEFVSLYRPEEMIGQRIQTLDWPYREALRIDEAMHPLTMIATGLYGKTIPKQNGAPLRLVVPWKYAFKSIKAITHIRLTEQRPVSSWERAVPSEYGFYANVNPEVPHPRWTQKRETRIGELSKRRTQMYNGYAEQVAHLYQGMNLEKNF